MAIKLFDLNIEKVLEHWGVEHALREIIANAIDEQILTQSKFIKIFQDNESRLHIKDYGRGIEYKHFVQNENEEKLVAPNLIGKFGVGLKDALAVFWRNGIELEIHSKFAKISLTMAQKLGFSLETLHAVFAESEHSTMEGTEFIFTGVTSSAIEKAKSMFLMFSNAKLLEKTKYGEVYFANNSVGFVYVNGVQVAIEENFLFSYNITNINVAIKKALNRERSNVGRTAYAESIRKILTQCKTHNVLLALVEDLTNIMQGTNKDESSWLDVSTYAAKTLNENENVVFLSPFERAQLTNQQVEILQQSGKNVILVPDTIIEKLGKNITTFSDITQEYRDSFTYEFTEISKLSTIERETFAKKDIVLHFLAKHNYKTNISIKISNTIRINEYGEETQGIYDSGLNTIIVKRSALRNLSEFLGVLVHEFAHFNSGASDNTREFENILTEMLGFTLTDIAANNTTKKKGVFGWPK